jgi:hypothetical protein
MKHKQKTGIAELSGLHIAIPIVCTTDARDNLAGNPLVYYVVIPKQPRHKHGCYDYDGYIM